MMNDNNIPGIDNNTCIKCGMYKLCKTPFMQSSGADKPKLLIVGEAPGESEDKDGIPFVGSTGRLLRNVIEEIGFTENEIRYTNVVRCRPVDNKISKRSINYCKQFAIDEIAEYDPKFVFLMGNSPLNGILGEDRISQWNGVIVNKERTYVPLYHPAHIARNQTMLDEWLNAMLDAVEGNVKSDRHERHLPQKIEELLEMRDMLSECEYISYDVETSSLDAFGDTSAIISASFGCVYKDIVYTWSFPILHKESWWTDKELNKVVYIVGDILESHSGAVIGQNIKFDQLQTVELLDIWFKAGGDAMIVDYLLDSRLGGHGLKRLAAIHLGMYDYEQELTDYKRLHSEADPYRGGSYANIPLKILLPYGGLDAEATILLHNKLYPQLSDKQKKLYNQVIMPASDALCEMQRNGLVVDEYIAKRYLCIYKEVRNRIYNQLLEDSNVKKVIKFYSKFKPKFKFNPNSVPQLQTLYFKYYDIPILEYTEKRSPCTKGKLYKHLENDYPILHKIRYYKLLSKMIGTYLEPSINGKWQSGDGIARTTYNMTSTKTGRLSSSDPNFQNIPTPEKEPGTLLETLPIKNIFTHPYVRDPLSCIISTNEYGNRYNLEKMYGDGVVMSVDYSGMELRIFASLAECEPMLEIHRSDEDFHTKIAAMITGKKYDSIDKPTRYIYKWTNWTIIFGGSAYTLHNLYNIPLDDAEAAMLKYFNMFPEVRYYQDDCVRFAEEHGYIESPFGRRENLYRINDPITTLRNADRRAAINMPVQSGASDTLLCALIIIANIIKKQNLKSKLVNTVHDSLMLYVPKDEIYIVSEICKDVMESVVLYSKIYMPQIDFSWLISPLKADVEIGTHYGSVVPIEKWSEYVN